MSTIDTSSIDATKPIEVSPTTGSVRDNFAEIKTQLNNANTEVDALVTANLALGTIKTQDSDNISITGGTIAGITDLAIVDGGTGQSTAQAAIDALSAVNGVTDGYILTARTNAAGWEINPSQVLPTAYINGLTLSNNVTDALNDIDIAVGKARDSSDTYDLALPSVFVKQIDAIWAVGTAAGGLFSGTVAINTWYHVFLIRKDTDGSIDAGFDTSVTAANIPTGYTAYKWIGSVLTDGSSNIIPFIQDVGKPNRFKWVAPVTDVSAAAPTASRTTAALSTPLGIKTTALIRNRIASTASTIITFTVSDLAIPDVASSSSNYTDYNHRNTTGFSSGMTAEVTTDTSSQVGYRGSAANSVNIVTYGWEVERGSV